MRALVVHTGGIGDFLLTCPALIQLAKTNTLTLAGNPDRLNLATFAGLAQETISLESIQFASIFSEPAQVLKDFVRQFDRIIIWMSDEGNHIHKTLETICTAQLHINPGLPPKHWTQHASEYFSETLGYTTPPNLRLKVPPSKEPHDIIIHPGSGGHSKNWPLEHYQALQQQLLQHQRNVTWSLGPAEFESNAYHGLSPTLTCESLTDLASHLAAARCYIGNDSGITHLAAAVGTPTIALFGPTSPNVWAPRGEHIHVLKNTFVSPHATLQTLTKLVLGR